MKPRYTTEFKRQAVALAESLGTAVGAAKQLGVSYGALQGWKMQFGNESLAGKSDSKMSPAEIDEVNRLRKENAELKKVNHILKAAAAFFSQDHLK